MGCCTGFSRVLLFIFNFFFWLSGAGLLGLGIWILVDPEIESYQDVIEDSSADGNFLEIAAYIMIGFGAFIFVVGFCGCCGALRKSKCLLGFYIFCLFLVFAGEIAAVVYVAVFRDEAEEDLAEGLKRSIVDHYNSGLSKPWDEVQEGLDCCGGTGPNDYVNSTWAEANPTVKIPTSCCVMADGEFVNKDTCQDMTDASAFHGQGCKDAIVDWIEDNSNIVIGVAAGLAALQIIILICAICFCRNMDKEDA